MFTSSNAPARTELGFRDSGGVQILHPPSVQFNLFQGEVLPYNPGTRDWVESSQSETPEAPTQSERAYSKREKAEREGQRGTVDSTWFVSVSGKKLARETFSGLGTN